jgi:hypothetical protein
LFTGELPQVQQPKKPNRLIVKIASANAPGDVEVLRRGGGRGHHEDGGEDAEVLGLHITLLLFFGRVFGNNKWLSAPAYGGKGYVFASFFPKPSKRIFDIDTKMQWRMAGAGRRPFLLLF